MRHIIGILVIGSLLSSCDYREAVTGNRRGMDYITRDDYRKALQELTEAIEHSPTYCPAYYNRAIAYANLNRPKEALRDMDYVVANMPDNAKAYAMFFTNSFITSLLKDTPPFPPSYILKIKKNPTAILSEETAHLFLERIEEILSDPTHHFCTEMARCVLQMFMMDMANEYLLQEHEATDYADMNRQNMLFQQFIKLIFAHIRETHSVGWYASQLCITPQYLNRIVKNSSQKTTYAHICTALTGAIIRQLENTDCPR